MAHNAGTDGDRRKALDSIYDYNKTLITLATGTIALSATFLGKELYRGVALWMLIVSWVVLGASIVCGLLGLGAYIDQYAESEIEPRQSLLEYVSLGQVALLLTGLSFLGWFAIDNVQHNLPGPPSSTTTTVPSKATSTTTDTVSPTTRASTSTDTISPTTRATVVTPPTVIITSGWSTYP